MWHDLGKWFDVKHHTMSTYKSYILCKPHPNGHLVTKCVSVKQKILNSSSECRKEHKKHTTHSSWLCLICTTFLCRLEPTISILFWCSVSKWNLTYQISFQGEEGRGGGYHTSWREYIQAYCYFLENNCLIWSTASESIFSDL